MCNWYAINTVLYIIGDEPKSLFRVEGREKNVGRLESRRGNGDQESLCWITGMIICNRVMIKVAPRTAPTRRIRSLIYIHVIKYSRSCIQLNLRVNGTRFHLDPTMTRLIWF